MIKCSVQECIVIDLMAKTQLTKRFRSHFKEDDIREAIKIGNSKIKSRGWFNGNEFSEEVKKITQFFKLFQISTHEIVLNNLVYRYRNESENGILLVTKEHDEIEIGVFSKAEFFAVIVKRLPTLLHNTNEIGKEVLVNDVIRSALGHVEPEFYFTYVVNEKLKAMSVVRSIDDKIIEEEVVNSTLKEINSKYLRTKLLNCLEGKL